MSTAQSSENSRFDLVDFLSFDSTRLCFSFLCFRPVAFPFTFLSLFCVFVLFMPKSLIHFLSVVVLVFWCLSVKYRTNEWDSFLLFYLLFLLFCLYALSLFLLGILCGCGNESKHLKCLSAGRPRTAAMSFVTMPDFFMFSSSFSLLHWPLHRKLCFILAASPESEEKDVHLLSTSLTFQIDPLSPSLHLAFMVV